ncbi:hypothetical protein V5O48_016821 [Marasmius crinis-equi]|uniref:WLM-domain-containing protein n=1 Tax=Marasmius crinis-equi TaxID=585013 RepID=A0ABR3EQQ4_9AGAR
MVHLRLNESETNPNVHINFITALPAHDPEDQENARQFLRALAAQVRPVMKAHGFVINSLEEYEHNSVFAGRNWNNGETVELVLRRPGGTFLPTSWLMSTLCHELAHIKHMNHGTAFQALWRRLRNEVRELQIKGYYGDGYWSSGRRLADSAAISGDGNDPGELPEYMCGGAQNRSRPTKRRKSRRPRETVPSNHTGRQTAKKRKPGSRVTSKYAFIGDGATLSDNAGSGHGTGKGKRANSNRARQERALAAERRLNMSEKNEQASTSELRLCQLESDDETSDGDIEFVEETDTDRRRALLDSGLDSSNKATWTDFDDDFIFVGNSHTGVIPVSEEASEINPGSSSVINMNGKRKADNNDNSSRAAQPAKVAKLNERNFDERTSTSTGLRGVVQGEIRVRRQDTLGMQPGKGSILGAVPTPTPKGEPPDKSTDLRHQTRVHEPKAPREGTTTWSCLVCTLQNKAIHLACSACGTTRGEERWHAPMAQAMS